MRVLSLLIVFFCAPFLSAEVMVEGAKFQPIKIAIPRANVPEEEKIASQLAQDVIETVREDLSWSSVFQVLDPRSFIANLDREGINKSTVNIDSWKMVNAQGLVKSRVRSSNNSVFIDVGIHWIEGIKPSKEETFLIDPKKIKEAGHRISDAILTFFTGEAGIFTSKIVATKSFSKGKKVVVLSVDGESEEILTKEEGIHILPTIAPQGDVVFYTTYRNNNANLMRVNIDGSNVVTFSNKPDLNTGAQVSPDGRTVVFTNIDKDASHIYSTDRDGKIKPVKITDSFGINISPSFSPDGSKIAFVSSRSGNPHIYIMNQDGSKPERLTFQGTYNQTPRFSPKGDYIAFTGRDENKKFDIFLLEMSTKKVTRVTQDQGNNEDPWFSPNGRLLVFTSTRNGTRELYISNLDGSMQRRVTKGGTYWTPSWGPS